ncbi:hypothetical protein MMC08_006059 [Hypocenomyce scalaris]|nr:hypothetical protein [Hypocenomyce scalaris]
MKMRLLEFIIPSLKSDTVSQQTFRAQWPLWCKTLVHAPGASQVHYGYMISENDIDVSSLMKLVISIKWNERTEFDDFLTSDEFKVFAGKTKPYALAPSKIELFESTSEGQTVFSKGITEVFRIGVSTDQKIAEVENAWVSFRDKVQREHDIKVLHGLSVNVPERCFVGAIGWSSLKERDGVNNSPIVAEARKKLLSFDNTSSFVVSMAPADATTV